MAVSSSSRRLSLLLLGIISFLSLMADLYAVQYMERYTGKPRYYALRLLMALGLNAAVMGADLVNLYIGVEVASLACYALVAFGMERQYLGASFRYQVFGALASNAPFGARGGVFPRLVQGVRTCALGECPRVVWQSVFVTSFFVEPP